MGYTTFFYGTFHLNKPLSEQERSVLEKLRDPREHSKELPDGLPDTNWCDWIVTKDGTGIEWDDRTEKFYDYVEWLQYIITQLLQPWGYTLNGTMEFRGECEDDKGEIVVEDNEITLIGGDRYDSD
jgi:hypothetical protein